MSVACMVTRLVPRVSGETTGPMWGVFWNLAHECISFLDGHDHLVSGQHDSSVDGGPCILGKLAEVSLGSSKKLPRALHVKRKITHRPIAKLVLGMHATELAIGMWTIVDDINSKQLVVATDHVVEDLSASRLYGQ